MAENVLRQTVGDMREVALTCWPLWLGFAFMWPVRYMPRTSVFFELYHQFGVYQLLGSALVLLAALLLYRRIVSLRKRKTLAGIAFAIGLGASIGFVLIGSFDGGAAALGGYFLIGCANAGFLLLWFSAFFGMRASQVMVSLALAALALSVIDGLILLLPDRLIASLMVLVPLASPALFTVWVMRRGLETPREEAGSPAMDVAGYRLLAVVMGCAFGLMSGLSVQHPSRTNDYFLVATLLILFVALAVSAPLVERRGFRSALTRFALPIVAAAYLLLPFASLPASVTNALSITGFFYFYYAMIAYFAAKRAGENSTLRSFSLFYFLLAASEFVSSFAIGRVPIDEIPSSMLFTIALVAVYVFFLVSSGFQRRTPVSVDVPSGERAFRIALEEAVAKLDLTEREREILVLIASGKQRRAIAQELYISEDTVKTHTRNIYRKLGVHSRSDIESLLRDL
ncbi:response regulator transcription factor [Raoultibacter phocaeensis]|uniref:response regulator transcription factor n=1 Tax=Raoultibacter phocaeensis TaxID=2479841 RepID=UPI00111A4017|nr:response regulator transcription factor [Raoultibacter phocaeensis]